SRRKYAEIRRNGFGGTAVGGARRCRTLISTRIFNIRLKTLFCRAGDKEGWDMAADPRTILLMNYYRDAELRGANLLFRLMSHLDDPDSQVKLSLHLADETRHAWLWTKRITDLGGDPTKVADGYQTRIGLRVVPRNLIDILALTVVVEERSHQRYTEHAQRADVDPETLDLLREVTKDEKWHIPWIKGKLDEAAA